MFKSDSYTMYCKLTDRPNCTIHSNKTEQIDPTYPANKRQNTKVLLKSVESNTFKDICSYDDIFNDMKGMNIDQ